MSAAKQIGLASQVNVNMVLVNRIASLIWTKKKELWDRVAPRTVSVRLIIVIQVNAWVLTFGKQSSSKGSLTTEL